jgi:hypothetical protein
MQLLISALRILWGPALSSVPEFLHGRCGDASPWAFPATTAASAPAAILLPPALPGWSRAHTW